MTERQLRLTNERVSPTIVTLGILTDSHRKFSTNVFLDPSDNNAWAVEDLSPLEQGLVFQHVTDKNSDVHVFMPFCVMDKKIGLLVEDLRSYRSSSPFISMHRAVNQSRKNPRSCIQNFVLSSTDFKVFRKKTSSVNWILESMSVDIEDLISLIREVKSVGIHCISRVAELRVSDVTEDSLPGVLTQIDELESTVSTVKISRVTISKEISRLEREIGRDKDKALVDSEYSQLVAVIDRLSEDDPTSLYRFFVQTVEAGSPAPVWVKTLEEELNALTKHYPAAKRLRANGDDIVLDLSGVRIVLARNSVRIEGDITALKPYVSVGGVKPSSGSRNRFSNILMGELDEGLPND